MDFHAFERKGWEDAGVCAHYHADLSAVTTQSIPALLAAAGVSCAHRVLDIATGAGYAAAQARDLGAETVGVDFSVAQLKLARQVGGRFWCAACDGGSLPFRDGSFDAVINNYGIPHFPDPARAVAEAVRVLRAGGRFAFSVWARAEEAIGFGVIYDAVRCHGRLDVGLPTGPNFFQFSDIEACTALLTAAGFADVRVARQAQVWRLASAAHLLRAIGGGTVRAAALLQAQSAEARLAIERQVAAALTPYTTPGGYELPMPAMIASALKP